MRKRSRKREIVNCVACVVHIRLSDILCKHVIRDYLAAKKTQMNKFLREKTSKKIFKSNVAINLSLVLINKWQTLQMKIQTSVIVKWTANRTQLQSLVFFLNGSTFQLMILSRKFVRMHRVTCNFTNILWIYTKNGIWLMLWTLWQSKAYFFYIKFLINQCKILIWRELFCGFC